MSNTVVYILYCVLCLSLMFQVLQLLISATSFSVHNPSFLLFALSLVCAPCTRLYSLTRKDWLYVLLGRFLRVTSVRLCAALVSVFSFPLAHRLNTSSRTECSTNLYIVCIIPPNHSNRYSQLKLNCVHPYQVLDTINLIVET